MRVAKATSGEGSLGAPSLLEATAYTLHVVRISVKDLREARVDTIGWCA
jgi:hypothetical protein